jgi:hypothetical protein
MKINILEKVYDTSRQSDKGALLAAIKSAASIGWLNRYKKAIDAERANETDHAYLNDLYQAIKTREDELPPKLKDQFGPTFSWDSKYIKSTSTQQRE